MAIEIKSYNQLLGNMVRKLIADTPLNDINTGSVLMSLLEAAAQNDFENNASILSTLELLSVDAISNSDLDARGADLGLTRISASKSTGFVSIGDSSIVKRSTGLYQVKPAPIAGASTLFVNNASLWAPTGVLYIGRGTASFEGPINYTSIVDNGSFYTITLASALQKDHLISDVVVDAQGTTDKLVSANTIVNIPSNNQNPTIEYKTLRDAVIPAGEDSVSDVAIVAVLGGKTSNAGINTITTFANKPFPSATVSNTNALVNGRDVEADSEYRERIKSFSNTLARGTKSAILSVVVGLSDPDDGKQVASAVITEPPSIGDPSILYIDDGTGFQPSFAGQGVDILLKSANGTEEFLQLANFPLPRPQAINIQEGPFNLVDQSTLSVLVDGEENTITYSADDFSNITAASLSEVIESINSQSTLFKATFTEDSKFLLLFPIAFDAETIEVVGRKLSDTDSTYANSEFKFPTGSLSYIRLYKNNQLLNEKIQAATIQTNVFSTWNIATDGNLIIQVDGTPPQDQTFTSNDFAGKAYPGLVLDDWVAAINVKFAGITATASSGGQLQLVSNKEGTASSVVVLGGSYFSQMFIGQTTSASGLDSDFQLNRQTGNIRLLNTLSVGDSISAGIVDAKGSVESLSTSTGNYNLSVDGFGRDAVSIFATDSTNAEPRTNITFGIGSTIVVTAPDSSTMRVMADISAAFATILPGDYIYITPRSTGWVPAGNAGLFVVSAKGGHTTAGTDTFIDMLNINTVPGTYTVLSGDDIQGFASDTYPQIWEGNSTAIPAAASLKDIIDSIETNTINVNSSIYNTNSIKLTSTTETDGSFATPISVGSASLLFTTGGTNQLGNPSHVANRTSSADFVSSFKRSEPTSTDVWLGRYTYSDTSGSLTTNATHGIEGIDTYSEELESSGILTTSNIDFNDIINLNSGSNDKLYRSIRDILAGDKIGTQFSLPKTVFNYTAGERFNIMRSNSISPDDNIVFILDKDSISKTIDIPLSRSSRVNNLFPPTDLSFSADDIDNEAGITYSTLQVWGKTTTNTEFKDYASWFQARNWYTSGGSGSGGGSMILRTDEFGPHGEKIRFGITYPSFPNKTNTVFHANTPDYSTATYVFGSDPLKPIGISAGQQIEVTSLGSDQFRYTFSGGTADLSTIIAGDVMSILDDAGLTNNNSGQFSILAVDDTLKHLDIYNPDGLASAVGVQEVTDITTLQDDPGTQTVSVVSGVLAGASIVDASYFTLEDTAGLVAVWYNAGTSAPTPGSIGVNRIIEITVVGTETANDISSLTAGIINADTKFTAIPTGTSMTITNIEFGVLLIATEGGTATTFGFAGNIGVVNNSIDGEYFILQDQSGSVAFWYNVTGITSEPLHGADRSVSITTVVSGDSANNVATKTAVVIVNDTQFVTATVSTNVITATDVVNGVRAASNAGTSGFTIAQLVAGVDDVQEVISVTTSFMIFPLLNTSLTDITNKINESPLMNASIIDDTNDITLATREEVYTPVGPTDFSASLSYNHDPAPTSGLNGFVTMHDSVSYVKDFSNSAPNFTLKSSLVLQSAGATSYSMETAQNIDGSIGEVFKLVPTTIHNMYQQFTHKALSQLPLVADVDVANDIRRIQVKSKLLGSGGAVEVIGGNANGVDFSMFGESQIISGATKDFIAVKTASFPVTLTSGDLVNIKNSEVTKRLSRIQSADTVDVFKSATSNVDYKWNSKTIYMNDLVELAVSDVSALHGRAADTIWRWTHSDAGSEFVTTAKIVGSTTFQIDDFDGTTTPTNSSSLTLSPISIDVGSATVEQQFKMRVNSTPTQSEYFHFQTPSGDTFAVWFNVNLNNTAPVGSPFNTSTYLIQVDILSTDTLDEVISKLATTLLADSDYNNNFIGEQTSGASFADVKVGDALSAYGTLGTGWLRGNMNLSAGDNAMVGWTVVGVDANASYLDVVNPNGQAMTALVAAGTVQINPTPVIEWPIYHSAKIAITNTVVDAPAGNMTITTNLAHGLRVGDVVDLSSNVPAQTTTITTVTAQNVFTALDTATTAANTYSDGFVIRNDRTQTKYGIEDLGFNDLFRVRMISGTSPRFIDIGVAVDDIAVLSGDTFLSNNNGTFRVLGVDNDSILIQNATGSKDLDTKIAFNFRDLSTTWVSNSSTVTGLVGTFVNISIGDWIKKTEDSDSILVQVLGFEDSLGASVSANAATVVVLGQNYKGTSGQSNGLTWDQTTGVGTGSQLDNKLDIRIFEGDSARITDTLFVDNIANTNWFNNNNSGSFEISNFGTDSNYRPFLRIQNNLGTTQTDRLMSVSTIGFFIIEGENNKYESIRKVEYSAINNDDNNKRTLYLTPATRSDKIANANGTTISPIGKLNYAKTVVAGIDGYTYYTGLLRTVQRTIDGYEPDLLTYPGRRAVGGAVETLAPLSKRISISVNVTTTDGVNTNEISNDIKSVIIEYIGDLGVGEDVVVAAMTVGIMEITGIEALVFSEPTPSTERIFVSDNEKANISPSDIFVS